MVKKLNLDSVSKKLDAMNKSLGQNLKTIIGDQQLKLRMMDKINPGKISVSPSTLLDKIAIVLTLVGTVIGLIQLMCATNPATIVVSAILVVLDFVLSIFTLVNNIKTIQQLEQQHRLSFRSALKKVVNSTDRLPPWLISPFK
jgi:F0F1-type ATP synthase assembly protein I